MIDRPETAHILVFDDVLPDPLAYRAKALRQRFQTVADGAAQFHGIALCADPTIPIWVRDHFHGLTPTTSFFRSSPLHQVEPHEIHEDRSMGDTTAIYYMNLDPPEGDGTKFFRHRATGEIASRAALGSAEWHAEAMNWFDLTQWECWSMAQAKFNRLVLFPAELFHARAIADNYGTDRDSARLIQVVFSDGALVPELSAVAAGRV